MRTIVIAALCILSATAAELLKDPSFSNPIGNWSAFGSGYSIVTSSYVDPPSSISCATSPTAKTHGATQTVVLSQTSPGAVRFSGWSAITAAVSPLADNDYSVYCDVMYVDGSYQYGVTAQFLTGAVRGWQFQAETIISDKPIKSINVYAMFRNHNGTVLFDKFSVAPVTLPTPSTSITYPIKLLVPLYAYPGTFWDDVINSASSSVPITIIANVNSGPGQSLDSTYLTYINKCKAKNIPVIGYVATNYGNNSLSSVQNQISQWKTWYKNVSGIFLDEGSNSISQLAYYSTLRTYINSVFQPSGLTFINPGTSTPENYTLISDNLMFLETDTTAFLKPPSQAATFPSGWPLSPAYSTYTSQWKYHTSGVAYAASASTYQTVVDTAISRGYGYIYVTDDTLPNPYDAEPTFWASLVTYIASKNK